MTIKGMFILIFLTTLMFLLGIRLGMSFKKEIDTIKKEMICEEAYYPLGELVSVYPDAGRIVIDLPESVQYKSIKEQGKWAKMGRIVLDLSESMELRIKEDKANWN